MTKRYAIATRVSTEDQGEKGGKTSLDNQRERAEEYVARQSGEVVKVYTEDGVSGGLEYRQRPAITEMLIDAEAGVMDAVVWDKADRQGRSLVEVALIEQELGGFGVEVHTVESGHRRRDTSDQVLIEGVRDLVSESEKLRIKERMAAGRYGGSQAGKWTGGLPVLGYAIDRDKHLVVHEGEAAVVRRMYDLVAQGITARDAVVVLNKEFDRSELPRRQGGSGYSNQHVYAAIRRRAYLGEGVQRAIKPHPNSEPEAVTIPAPPIVDEELWQRANSAINGRQFHSPKRPRSQRRPYGLGNGRVRHVHENGRLLSMTGVPRNDRKWMGQQVTQRDYRCSASVSRRGRYGPNTPDRCPGFGDNSNRSRMTSIQARFVEADVLLQILERIKDPDTLARWVREQDTRAVAEVNFENLGIGTPEALLAAAEERLVDIDHERKVLNRQERKGQLSEVDADEEREGLDLEETKTLDIIARQRKALAKREAFDAVYADLISMPIGWGPGELGWETTYLTDANGEDWVEEPGWTEVAKWLADEAQSVLDRTRWDLSENAIRWVARMADIFDITVNVFDVGEAMPRIEAEGSIPLEPPQISGEANHDLQRNRLRTTRPERLPPALPDPADRPSGRPHCKEGRSTSSQSVPPRSHQPAEPRRRSPESPERSPPVVKGTTTLERSPPPAPLLPRDRPPDRQSCGCPGSAPRRRAIRSTGPIRPFHPDPFSAPIFRRCASAGAASGSRFATATAPDQTEAPT